MEWMEGETGERGEGGRGKERERERKIEKTEERRDTLIICPLHSLIWAGERIYNLGMCP